MPNLIRETLRLVREMLDLVREMPDLVRQTQDLAGKPLSWSDKCGLGPALRLLQHRTEPGRCRRWSPSAGLAPPTVELVQAGGLVWFRPAGGSPGRAEVSPGGAG